ncbi:hypothetical protein SARC_06268 [Sphaeroforma arctica JP610]|uniref:Uncharacterized protein n=1 Tax=Sphaeroforma arctica JP610 TaxID=667725 RepID=A0A0L0FXM5_9EUKA|nr:hypothetical protein SARC_06268 [Sphaeroforma arctica JP610]KNC81404.1 hypothetical protein SARC_06268 [Sphaeroforma arctica JP610]|eukprot:XP_014155306.1 hypothetical protein SARC_06268 [Sphaeroforma arctica JP610]
MVDNGDVCVQPAEGRLGRILSATMSKDRRKNEYDYRRSESPGSQQSNENSTSLDRREAHEGEQRLRIESRNDT